MLATLMVTMLQAVDICMFDILQKQKVITKLEKLLKCWMLKFDVILQGNKIKAWKVAKVGKFGTLRTGAG